MSMRAQPMKPPRRIHWLDALLCAAWVGVVLGGLYLLADGEGFSPYLGPFHLESACFNGHDC